MKLAQKLALAITGASISLITMQAKSVEAASLNLQSAFQATGIDTARSLFGVDGTGIKIGVISDSFNTSTTSRDQFGNRDTYQTDITNGYLPSGIEVLQDRPGGTDEGRAILELIHAIAPGASLVFHSASSPTEASPAYFAQAIQSLKDAGANIIVDDIEFYNPPFNTSVAPVGPIDQAIQSVFSQGISYFTSAGNQFPNPAKPIFNFKNDPNAITVGAVYYGNDLISPYNRITRQGQLEPFTSISVPPYIKPDISAPDGLNISFNLGGNPPVDGDGFSLYDSTTGFYNFFGTSASAPYTAAVAALLRQAVPDATPDEIYTALRNTAKPLDPNQPGFSNRSGYGLIQADKALLALGAKPKEVPENSSNFSLLTLGVLGAGLLMKRRQQQQVPQKV